MHLSVVLVFSNLKCWIAAIRKELARRGQANSDEWKTQMREAKHSLEQQSDEHKAVTAGWCL